MWHFANHDYILIDPVFKHLQDDPKFNAIVKKVQNEKAGIRAYINQIEERGEIDL